MPDHHHHPKPHPGEARSVRVVTVTASSTRTRENDEGGRVLGELLAEAGFVVVRHAIVKDDRDAIRGEFSRAIDEGEADAVVITGGTGIAPGDVTYDAVRGALGDELEGFGEAFRRLSWDEIGARAMLSRAVAGRYNKGLVFALPGSVPAVRLGAQKLIAPVLRHAVELVKG